MKTISPSVAIAIVANVEAISVIVNMIAISASTMDAMLWIRIVLKAILTNSWNSGKFCSKRSKHASYGVFVSAFFCNVIRFLIFPPSQWAWQPCAYAETLLDKIILLNFA